MAEIWAAAIGAAAAVGGAYMSADAQKDAAKRAGRTQGQLTTTLGNSSLIGPGGTSADIWQDGKGGNIGLGQFQNPFNQLLQFGSQNIQNAGSAGYPAGLSDSLSRLTGASGTPGLPGMDLQNQVGGVFGQTLAGLGNRPNFNQVRDETLANLRQQAQPFEQRQFNSLQNDQFATGRLGTTGGGLQTEAFARGLGQADTQRQLFANQEARNVQNNEDQLLQSAFGRFFNTAGLAQGLQQERFGNSVLTNNMGYDRALQDLNTRIGLAQLPTQLQGQQLQLGLQGLQGAQSLSGMGLQQFQAALAAAQAGANARIGSGSNVAALAGIQAQMPTSGDIWGQALTGIGARVGGDMNGLLSGLFNRGAPKTTQPVTPTYGQPYNGAWS